MRFYCLSPYIIIARKSMEGKVSILQCSTPKKKKKKALNSTSSCELFSLSHQNHNFPANCWFYSVFISINIWRAANLHASVRCTSGCAAGEFPPVQEPPGRWHCQDLSIPSLPPEPALPSQGPKTTSQLLSFQADYNYSLSKLTLQVTATFNSVH